jgi:hypothetical protein
MNLRRPRNDNIDSRELTFIADGQTVGSVRR